MNTHHLYAVLCAAIEQTASFVGQPISDVAVHRIAAERVAAELRARARDMAEMANYADRNTWHKEREAATQAHRIAADWLACSAGDPGVLPADGLV